jgi:hypothetical protein
MPQSIDGGTVVSFGDSFLIVGGRDAVTQSKLSTIYHYNPDEESWILMGAGMEDEKSHVIAMMVDRQVFE